MEVESKFNPDDWNGYLHTYETIEDYNAYLENGAFFLTKKQLEDAYKEYKKYRNIE